MASIYLSLINVIAGDVSENGFAKQISLSKEVSFRWRETQKTAFISLLIVVFIMTLDDDGTGYCLDSRLHSK